MHRVKIKLAAAIAGLTLLAACTTTVAGSAKPKPGQGPIEQATDACSLLSPEQATAAGLQPKGVFKKADKSRKLPPSCDYKDSTGKPGALTVTWSTEITVDQYYNGSTVKEELQLGGLKWTRFNNPFGDAFCSLMTKTSDGFVDLLGTNFDEKPKACDIPKIVAPLVSSHLPGGAPVTALPKPSTSQPPSPSPLDNVKACDLFKPEQITALKLDPAGMEELGKSKPDQPGCEWHDTDGDRGQKSLDVWFGLKKAATEWPYLEKDGEQIDAGGRKWNLYPAAGDEVTCSATLVITPTSSVMITSGYLDDASKICDLVRATIPVITPTLPS